MSVGRVINLPCLFLIDKWPVSVAAAPSVVCGVYPPVQKFSVVFKQQKYLCERRVWNSFFNLVIDSWGGIVRIVLKEHFLELKDPILSVCCSPFSFD